MARIKQITSNEGDSYQYQEQESDLIGGGAFGQVYKGWKLSTIGRMAIQVAVKVVPLTLLKEHGEAFVEAINNEIKTMEAILNDRNPYVIKIIESFESGNNIYIITEYCDGGDLKVI
jgi:serine/threonine protein kinase